MKALLLLSLLISAVACKERERYTQTQLISVVRAAWSTGYSEGAMKAAQAGTTSPEALKAFIKEWPQSRTLDSINYEKQMISILKQ